MAHISSMHGQQVVGPMPDQGHTWGLQKKAKGDGNPCQANTYGHLSHDV